MLIIVFVIWIASSFVFALLLARIRKNKTNICVKFFSQTNQQEIIMQKLSTVQSLPVDAKFFYATADGEVQTTVVGIPVWKSFDESVATVTAAADGLSATVVGVGAGTATITLNGEGDPVAGQDPIVGSFDVTVTLPEANEVLFTAGTPFLTPAPAPAPKPALPALVITADDKTINAGDPLPQLTASYSGFVNGDTAGSLGTPPTLSTTATTGSPAGTYPITASGAVDDAYAITYVTGTLTIN